MPLPSLLFRAPILPEETVNALVLKAQGGDLKAREAVVAANLRLVADVAGQDPDAFQAGAIGLMNAVATYDPEKGTAFPTWAAWHIRALAQKEGGPIVKGPGTRDARTIKSHARKARAEIAGMGLEPTNERVAVKLGVPVEAIEKAEWHSVGSLDSSSGDSESSLMDTLADGAESIEAALCEQQPSEQRRAKILQLVSTMGFREKILYEQRFSSAEPCTLQELADTFGCTRQCVQQIEAKMVKKIQKLFT